MIRELKTLIAVAQSGTFAAAGANIGLTQAAVSAQMARLEQEIGAPLFDRVGRTARLNPRGQQVLQQAQALVRLYGELGTQPAEAANALVSIGAIASLQRSFLPSALAQFHRQHPSGRSRIVPGVSMELMNLVDAGEIDVAAIIRPPFALHSDLRWTPLAREPFRLIVPRAVSGDDWAALLASQPFIRYDRASFGGRQVDRFLRGMSFGVREVSEADELEAIVQLVANGVGVALVPQTTTQRRWPVSVRALDLGAATFHRDVGLVHRVAQHLSDPAQRLVRLICAQAGRPPLPATPRDWEGSDSMRP